MDFITDKQTIGDLNLFGKYKYGSIYSLFDETVTAGGEKLLEQIFRNPLKDQDAINRRSDIFRYFEKLSASFPFSREELDQVENYLSVAAANSLFGSVIYNLKKKALHSAGLDNEFPLMQKDFFATVALLKKLDAFLDTFPITAGHPIDADVAAVKGFLSLDRLKYLKEINKNDRLPLYKFIYYDILLRVRLSEKMSIILSFIYQLDVYITVSRIAKQKGFSYAVACSGSGPCLKLEGCWHPGIDGAVVNSVEFNSNTNMIFLTGANMAGKSTLMKAVGVAMYLAHIGFPVSARKLEFSVIDGLFTSINLPDNMAMGYSHFYAEVKRVKMIASEVAEGKRLLVILDELFKGTNVKDAYDATLGILKAFIDYSRCCFIVSTHIVEVAHALSSDDKHIRFVFMPTVMDKGKPSYPYKLQEGISADRHGMMIINNEGIIDTIRDGRCS